MAELCLVTEESKSNWLLGDHLGSTSMVANASGVVVGEARYSAFGEAWYDSGTMTTDYLYTGQRQEAEIGLYYYVARWYDPAIGRFIQADSVVPNPMSAKGFDRYAYGVNNPVKYADPSGHRPATLENGKWEIDNELILDNHIYAKNTGAIERTLKGFGVHVRHMNDPDNRRLNAIARGVLAWGHKLYSDSIVAGNTPQEAFKNAFIIDDIPIHFLGTNNGPGYSYYGGPTCDIQHGGCNVGTVIDTQSGEYVRLVKFVSTYRHPISAMNNAIHELGHVFSATLHGRDPENTMPDNFVRNRELILKPRDHNSGITWQMNTQYTPNETFADLTVSWVQGEWLNTDQAGEASSWMDENMKLFANP